VRGGGNGCLGAFSAPRSPPMCKWKLTKKKVSWDLKKSLRFYNISPEPHNSATMTPGAVKRQRSLQKTAPPSKKRKIKRQADYHSSSDEDSDVEQDAIDETEQPIEAVEDDEDEALPTGDEEDESQSEDEDTNSEASDEDDNPNNVKVKRKKRNDPTAFANSISKILNAKLSVAKRADPVLARSKEASAAVKETQEARLEAAVKQQLREEKKSKLDTGRVKDVKGLNDPKISTEDIILREKKYKKLAQQGVIRLFNAVLTAQMKGQEAAKTAKQEGVVGMAKREEKVNEMSKQGFLDLIAGGGKK
jgi:fusion and transport protein UGO1